MIGAFFYLFLFSDFDLLLKAENSGYFYKNVSCETVLKCEEEGCFESDGKKYLCRQKDSTRITADYDKNSLVLTVAPDPDFMAYYLYLKKGKKVDKIKLKQRVTRFENGKDIDSIQILGLSSTGPVVLYKKEFRKGELFPFSGTLEKSINSLRESLGLNHLSLNKSLKKTAQVSLKKIKDDGLFHISAESGSPHHQGVRSSFVGENLFKAASVEKGWEMMQRSPSHLYNIINPEFSSIWIETEFYDGFFRGSLIFSN